jgi:HD-GYP domain-containing protein (c-di-GMP phosphodiesterase class II)
MSQTLMGADALIPISLFTLKHASAPGVNIYLRPNPGEIPVLFCAETNSLDLSSISRLQLDGVTKLYICCDDKEKYQLYLRGIWRDLFADESQPLLNRVAVMTEVIRDVLEEQFATGTTDSIVATCKEFGAYTADALGREPVGLKELAKVLHHDYATFTHAANVAIYAVVLGRAIGLNIEQLEEIATGALLHDLGTLQIDERILNKPARFTEEETKEVRKHTALGLERVSQRTDLTFGQFMMIYQHHERSNGSGYPVGCSHDEIHPWARLCAIVDVYDALTSIRPYRPAMSTKTAYAVLERGRGSEFDEEMLSCWLQLMKV